MIRRPHYRPRFDPKAPAARARSITLLTLQRARKAVAERTPERSQQSTLRALGDERLRAIVERYMENDEPLEDIVRAGFERADVERVTRLIKLNEYKRRQAPVGVRVTRRSFGKDWRYPITNRFRA